MPGLPKVGDAFGKLKDMFVKLLPIFGVVVGILSMSFIGTPLARIIKDFIQTKLNVSTGKLGFFAESDFKELLWWIPTGLIMGGIAMFIGSFVKGVGGVGSMVGGFIQGLGLGFMIGAILIPFAEDIGLSAILKT